MLPQPPFPESDPDVIVCDVDAMSADLATIEVLARLRLSARRLGCGLLLRGASRELAQLVAFCGLADALPCEPLAPGGLAGSPKRGNIRAVSRNELIPVIFPSEISST